MSKSKQAKLLKHLQSGAELTAKQISGTFGLKNPHDAVRQLRSQGYCIYSNPSKLSTGEKVTRYRLGQPSKRMVQIANAILGADAFTARRGI